MPWFQIFYEEKISIMLYIIKSLRLYRGITQIEAGDLIKIIREKLHDRIRRIIKDNPDIANSKEKD